MATQIDVKESIADKSSWFNVKRFSFKSIRAEGPIKTIDMSNLTAEQLGRIKGENIVLERSRLVKDAQEIRDILTSRDDGRIKTFFGTTRWMGEHTSLMHMTLKFNPYAAFKKFDAMAPFFDYYYQHSKDMLFVPNIKLQKFDPETKRQVEVASMEQYKQFIDETHDYLNTKNNKPIFVPIPVRLSMSETIDLLNHHLKKKRTHLWLDFEGKPVDQHTTARISQINRILSERGVLGQTIIYATNVKREIMSNNKDDQSPASDVLCPIVGASFVGVNRDPARFFPGSGQMTKQIVEHKARIFNPDTYYYTKSKARAQEDKKANVLHNAIMLQNEFDQQTSKFLPNQTLIPYLSKKEMLTSFGHGDLLTSLKKEPAAQSLKSWF